MTTYNVLTFGAAYGSLLATKLLFGGHKITMVCLPAEIEDLAAEARRLRPDVEIFIRPPTGFAYRYMIDLLAADR